MEYAIAGVAILPLILGLVEFLKKFGVDGEWSALAAVVMGSILGGVYYAMEQGLIPEMVAPYIGVAVFGLAFGLSAAGLYDLGKRYFGNK